MTEEFFFIIPLSHWIALAAFATGSSTAALILVIKYWLQMNKEEQMDADLKKKDDEIRKLKHKELERQDKEFHHDLVDMTSFGWATSFSLQAPIDFTKVSTWTMPLGKGNSLKLGEPVVVSDTGKALSMRTMQLIQEHRQRWRRLEYSLQDKGTYYAGKMFTYYDIDMMLHFKLGTTQDSINWNDNPLAQKYIDNFLHNKGLENAGYCLNRWERMEEYYSIFLGWDRNITGSWSQDWQGEWKV